MTLRLIAEVVVIGAGIAGLGLPGARGTRSRVDRRGRARRPRAGRDRTDVARTAGRSSRGAVTGRDGLPGQVRANGRRAGRSSCPTDSATPGSCTSRTRSNGRATSSRCTNGWHPERAALRRPNAAPPAGVHRRRSVAGSVLSDDAIVHHDAVVWAHLDHLGSAVSVDCPHHRDVYRARRFAVPRGRHGSRPDRDAVRAQRD